jgi:DNA polymerase phi
MEIGTKDKQLGSKAGAILQGRVAGNKEVPVVEDVESAGSVLTAIHDIARGSPSREFLGLCSNCSVYVTKAIAHMPSSSRQPAGAAVEIVTKTYAASLKEVMTKKNSRLHISFISDLIARQPLQAWPLRRDVLKYAGGEGVNDHQQTEAFDLMTAIGKQLTVVSQSVDASEVKDWIAGARKVLYGVLEKESSDDGSWQAPRVNKVIKTALQIARFSKAVLKTSEEVASVWESDKTAELGRKLLQTKRMQNNGSVRTLFGQFELSVSPAAQAAQQRRKDEKKDKKRRRQDGDEAVAEGEAMDVDQEESAATPKKPAKKQAKQAATKGEGQQSRGGGGDKKVKKRKVAA